MHALSRLSIVGLAAAVSALAPGCGGRQQAGGAVAEQRPEPGEADAGPADAGPVDAGPADAAAAELCPSSNRVRADLFPVESDGPVGSVELVGLRGGEVRVRAVLLGVPRGSYQLELSDQAYCPVLGETEDRGGGPARTNSQRPPGEGGAGGPSAPVSLGTVSAGPDGWVQREWTVPGASLPGLDQLRGRGLLLRRSGAAEGPAVSGTLACGILSMPGAPAS